MGNAEKNPLVFDLDGTLIDSRLDIAAACNHTLKELGLSELSAETIAGHVGSGARALLQGVLGDAVDSLDLGRVLKIFQSYYVAHPTEHNSLMPGAAAAMALRGERRIAMCTNKPAHLTQAVVDALGWGESFDVIVAPRPRDKVKPDPQLLVRVANELGVEASSLIMIGDGPQDVGAAQAVGAHAIGVKGGLLPLERLVASKPDILLETLEELPAYLSSRP